MWHLTNMKVVWAGRSQAVLQIFAHMHIVEALYMDLVFINYVIKWIYILMIKRWAYHLLNKSVSS